MKLTPDERTRLTGGSPVTKLLDVDGSQVAVFGAVWIDAPIRRYVEAINDIDNFGRRGGVTVTRRIRTPPTLEDFAAMRLPAQDVQDLRTCRVGDCEVKFGAQAIERCKTGVDWKASDAAESANALMRQLALRYVTGYLEGGNPSLAVYRDSQRPTFVAEEFRTLIDRMPELTTFVPEIRRYLLGYPQVGLPDSRSFLYWQEAEFGLKPTIRINHLTIREGPDDTVVASKMLYASHYFWTGLELRALLPDPSRGQGFWFVMDSCSRADGLRGFTAAFVRRRVQSEVQATALTALQSTKQMLEAGR